jgi:O-antigen/teichoic acid export membrane protein
MGIIKRQSLKTSIVNYIGVLIGVIFFNFIFPHLISEEYLGLIGLLQNLTYVLVSFPALGLAHVLLRYYSNWKDTSTTSHFNAFAFLAMAFAFILFSVIYLFNKEIIVHYYKAQSSLFIPYYYVVLPLIAIMMFTQYLEIYNMVRMRVAVPAFLREIVLRILLILLLFIFIYKLLNEQQFIFGFVLVYGITFVLLLLHTIRKQKFSTYHPSAFFKNNPGFSQQISFGFGMLLVTIFTNIHNFLDGIILPAYLGLATLGIYMRPLVLGQMIQVPYRAISLISIPIIREAIVQNDMKKVQSLNKSISINLFLIGCFLFTLLIVNADGIFSLLPISYASAKSVLYIIATGRLLDMAFGLNSEILNASKYFKFITIFSGIMMFLTIGLNMLLIPRYGMNGAAFAVSISLLVFNMLKSYIIYSKFHFHSFSKTYIPIILISLGVIVCMHFVPLFQFVQHHMFMNACINIVFHAGVAAILFIGPLLYFRLSPDVNQFAKLVISGKLFKGGHKMEEL